MAKGKNRDNCTSIINKVYLKTKRKVTTIGFVITAKQKPGQTKRGKIKDGIRTGDTGEREVFKQKVENQFDQCLYPMSVALGGILANLRFVILLLLLFFFEGKEVWEKNCRILR